LGPVNRAQLLGEEERFSPETVAEKVRAHGPVAKACASTEAVAEALVGAAKPGDVILIMSNGSFGGLTQRLLERLQPVGSAR
jgi:UDP-N-acetylmuramate: L-alanyl-gamma-D-glutamyl-meso-diaminopimelate ligase